MSSINPGTENQTVCEPAKKLIANIIRFLAVIGEPGTCKGCGQQIYWVRNPKSGKRLPVTIEALNHFADCPQAGRFRKNKNPDSGKAGSGKAGPPA